MNASPAETVDDAADPRVADFVGLRDADRQERGVIVVEGLLAVRQLEGSRFPVRSILVTPNRVADVADLAAAVGAPLLVASQVVMDAVTGFHIHRGVVASAERPPALDVDAVLASARLVAVLENVTDHENLGAMFRNAAAFGVDAVLACPRTADPFYRRSIRVSLGHALRVPFARLEPWPPAIGKLRERGFDVVALTPDPSAQSIDEVASADDARRVALLLGAEGSGLTDDALDAADLRVRIPIAAGVDSLNVATAAAVAFRHFSRVR